MSDSLRNPHRDEIAQIVREVLTDGGGISGGAVIDSMVADIVSALAAAFPVLEAPPAIDADWLAPHLANLFYNWDRGIEPPESIKDAAAEVAALVVAVVAERSRDLAEDAADESPQQSVSRPVLEAPPNPQPEGMTANALREIAAGILDASRHNGRADPCGSCLRSAELVNAWAAEMETPR